MKTKVLFILGTMAIGGVQSGIMNFAKLMNSETELIDVMVLTSEIGFHEKEFREYGEIYRIPLINKKGRIGAVVSLLYNNYYFKRRLYQFLLKNPYDVVHCKSLNYCAAASEAAKKAGVPVIVTQSHVDKPDHLHPFFQFYFKWCAKRIEKSATCKLAVSEKASEYLYGKYGGIVIKNPTISLERLDPSKYPQNKHSEIVLVQIGSFSERKNQIFSLHVLNELKKIKSDAKLIIVGFPVDNSGYEERIKKNVDELNLRESVEFLPGNSDVPAVLAESDYMLIPSLREGLPNVALEAQAMGVSCFLSDTITNEADCGLCTFISLNAGAKVWAEKIVEYRKINGSEKRYVDMSAWDNREIYKQYVEIWNDRPK